MLGLNGAGKTTLLRMLAGVDAPDTGEVEPGHGLRSATTPRSTRRSTWSRTVLENMQSAAPDARRDRGAQGARLLPLLRRRRDKPAGVLSGGEKTRLSLATARRLRANVLLLDEPTNNLDPASREPRSSGRCATYEGAVVLVTHDEGAVDALEPERILLLPDGVEDLWGPDYMDLISLA